MKANRFFISALVGFLLLLGGNAFAAPLDESYIQDAYDTASRGAEAVFPYTPDNTYRIYCKDTFLTDIKLQAGEDILFIGGGDTARWTIERAPVGNGALREWHLYIKPFKRGIETNIIITTSKRSYQINAVAAGFYNPMVSWSYGSELKGTFFRKEDFNKQEEDTFLTINPENLNFGYRINKKGYSWSPQEVFDDGKKTYIKMKNEMANSDAPALFLLEGKDQAILVNYRVVRNYYVVDRLFTKAVLALGNDKVIIKKN